MKVSAPSLLLLTAILTLTNLLSAQPNSTLREYIVNSNKDDPNLDGKHYTLRKAINWANENGGNCRIVFSIDPKERKILLLSPLPALTQAGITIHATSEIILDGSCIPNAIGIKVNADNSKIFGLTFQNFRIAIHVENSKSIINNTVIGKKGKKNHFRFVDNPSYPDNNFECAILADNANGLLIEANTIDYEYQAFQSFNIEAIWSGIKIRNSHNVFIKSNSIYLGYPNLINTEVIYYSGIYLANVRNGKIEHNIINGLNDDPTLEKQDKGVGIFTIGEQNTQIAAIENTILNCGYGVLDDGKNTQLHLSKNAIYKNCKAGIERSPRNEVPVPIILSVEEDVIRGVAEAGSMIEIFVEDASTDPCQGKRYVGLANTDENDQWSFQIISDTLLSGGLRVAATATYSIEDQNGNSYYNTSEFSACKQVETNDVYAYASLIPVGNNPCASTYVTSTLEGATVSIPLDISIENDSIGGHNDIWFKVIIPHEGRLLIKQSADTEIQTNIDVWRGTIGNNRPVYRIEESFDKLYSDLQFHIIPDTFRQGQTLFIRVWDENDRHPGSVSLAAQMLSESSANPVLCDEEEGVYIDNQFIVHFRDTVKRTTINRFTKELEEQGGKLVDYYYGCDSFYIQLWGVGDVTELESCRQVAAKKGEVDTLYLNLVADNLLCSGFGQVTDFNFVERGNITRPDEIITIAVIDSGVDTNNHYLKSYLVESRLIDLNRICEEDRIYSTNFVNERNLPIDNFEHGNAVGTTIVSNLPPNINLKIINLKAFNGKKGSFFDMLQAFAYAIEHKVDVINFSGGFDRIEIPRILDTLLAKAEQEQILIVTSAGNLGRDLDDENYNKWPASARNTSTSTTSDKKHYDNILVVGSYFENRFDRQLIRAYFSNYGDSIVYTSGIVQSAALGSPDGRGLSTFAGTSLSTAVITRLATIIKSNDYSLKGASLKEKILNTVKNSTNAIDVSDELTDQLIYYPQRSILPDQATNSLDSRAQND